MLVRILTSVSSNKDETPAWRMIFVDLTAKNLSAIVTGLNRFYGVDPVHHTARIEVFSQEEAAECITKLTGM